jgi:hypothetical protein
MGTWKYQIYNNDALQLIDSNVKDVGGIEGLCLVAMLYRL